MEILTSVSTLYPLNMGLCPHRRSRLQIANGKYCRNLIVLGFDTTKSINNQGCVDPS